MTALLFSILLSASPVDSRTLLMASNVLLRTYVGGHRKYQYQTEYSKDELKRCGLATEQLLKPVQYLGGNFDRR